MLLHEQIIETLYLGGLALLFMALASLFKVLYLETKYASNYMGVKIKKALNWGLIFIILSATLLSVILILYSK